MAAPRRTLALLAALLVGLAATPRTVQADPPRRGVVMNVNSLQYTSFMFADALREGQYLGVPGSNGSQLVNLDSKGLPTAAFEILWIVNGQQYAAGTYAINFVGTATVDFPGSIPAPSVSALTQDPTTKRTTGTVTFPAGFSGNVSIAFRNPTRKDGTPGLDEWHLYRPTTLGGATPHNLGELYSRPFLGMLAPLYGYRALDLANTNGDAFAMAALSHTLGPSNGPSPADQYLLPWSARRLPGDPLQAGPGNNEMAVELLIAAANSDPAGIKGDQALWFPIRDYASPEWIDNFFYTIRYGSDGVLPYTGPPGSNVVNPYTGAANPQPGTVANPAPIWAPLRGPLIVEFGNEMWNSFFSQFGRNVRLAQLEVRSGPSDLNWDNRTPDGDAFTLAYRRVGRGIKYISDRGKAILPAGAFGTTFFPVLMGQQGTPAVCQSSLDYLVNKVGAGSVGTILTHAGCAFYDAFGIPNGLAPNILTTDQIIGTGMVAMSEPAGHVAICKPYGLKFAAYEGGANIAVPGALQETWDRTNSDPRTWRYTRSVLDNAFATDPIVQFLGVFDDTGGGWACMNTTYDLTSALAGKYRATVAGAQAWTATPAGASSTDPIPPLATITGVSVSAPAPTLAALGSEALVGTVLGANAPISLVGWYASDGSAPGGVYTAPGPANVARQVVVTAYSAFRPAISGSTTLTIPAVVGAAPPLTDSSFETVRIPSTGVGFSYGPIPGSPWSFTSSSGITLDGVGFATKLGDDGFGPQFGFLQGSGSMSRTVAGWTAGSYRLSLLAAQRFDQGNATNTLRVLVDGQLVGTFTPNPTDTSGNATHAWVNWQSPTFAVGAGSHTLTLAATGDGPTDVSLLLDNVNLTSTGQAPPAATPATLRQLLERLRIVR